MQEIHLSSQPSLLNPVSALRRLISAMNTTDDDPLFSYVKGEKQVTLTKARGLKIFTKTWKDAASPKLTGHYFRVGGASLRWNLNHPLNEIVAVGRWKSKAYKLYIREYSEEVLLDMLRLLEQLAT